MSDRPRFTIEMTIRDNYKGQSWHRAMGCDEALSISERDVDGLKAGVLFSTNVSSLTATVTLMQQREMRRDLLLEAARRLSAQMADRLEDAEGWHDPSRIEPAKRALRGG